MTGYKNREISPLIREALEAMPVVVLTGMRQTGKSTLLRRDAVLSRRRYVSLDDFSLLAEAREDPEKFIESDEPLTIDEAQKCPELLTAIKRSIDRKRVKGRFLLSGSANFSMLKGITESLAGRAVYLVLHPFTWREASSGIGHTPFLKRFFSSGRVDGHPTAKPIPMTEILAGGMPAVRLGERGGEGGDKDAGFWFRGYEQTYLEKDVRDLSRIGDIIPFRNLLHLVALRTGQLVSPSEVGRDAKLSAATASRYLSLLEASFVACRIAPYLRNPSSRLIKTPKMYLGDSGLANYLAGVSRFDVPPGVGLKGAMLETWVAQNLLGILHATWLEAELFFWNVQGRHEVDFVIEAGGACMALEVKAGTRWSDGDLSGLKAFLASTPQCKAAILAYNGATGVKLGDRLWALPLGLVLS